MALEAGQTKEAVEMTKDLSPPVWAKVSCLFVNEAETRVCVPFGSVVKSVRPRMVMLCPGTNAVLGVSTRVRVTTLDCR